MPTYEYGCTSCGHTWETEQSIKEPATTQCPKCKELAAKRLISPCAFTLNGPGWAKDGYR